MLSGAATAGAAVFSGGTEALTSGLSQSGASLTATGLADLIVSSGATTVAPTVGSGATLEVRSGGTVTGVTLLQGGHENFAIGAVASGNATITASNSGLSATSSVNVAITAPTITRVSPTHGSTAGGDRMDIYGASLSVNTSVTIQGHAASVLSGLADGSMITVTVPAGAAGSADVVVSNPATGSTTMAGGYTYVNPSSILFQDSFNLASLNNWSISPLGLLGNWTAATDIADYNGGGHTQLYAGSNAWTDYTVEARFNVFSINNYPGGLRGRVNTATGAGYEAWILPGSKTIVLYRTGGWSIDSPGLTALGSFTVANMDPNVFHSLKLSFSGSSISVIYDGLTIIQATDSNLTSGAVALDVSNQHMQFDDIFVVTP